MIRRDCSRREVLQTTASAGLLGSLAGLEAFLLLSPASAADARVTPDVVSLSPDIEPIVRLIEQTPRERCFDMMAGQLRAGLPYREFLAALFFGRHTQRESTTLRIHPALRLRHSFGPPAGARRDCG